MQLLYKVATVFPTQDLLRVSGPSSSYTLPPGQHVYPFNFKARPSEKHPSFGTADLRSCHSIMTAQIITRYSPILVLYG